MLGLSATFFTIGLIFLTLCQLLTLCEIFEHYIHLYDNAVIFNLI